MYHISFIEENLLPRERLLSLGAEKLSNQELLAILIRTGNRKQPVQVLANQLLARLNSLADLRDLSVQELQELSGIGQVKAIEIKAMIELGKRINQAEIDLQDQVLSSEKLAKKLMAELGDKKQEHLVALYLDTQNRIIKQETLFIGTVNRSLAEPRAILHHAIKCMATSLIIAHNHPSGFPHPSDNDRHFTQRLNQACQLMDVILLDHLIIGRESYYSFREESTLG